MFFLIGMCPLLAFIYLHPQEVYPALRTLPLLNLFTGISALGLVLDLRLHYTRVTPPPVLRWMVLFAAWGAAATILRIGASRGLDVLAGLAITWVIMLLLAHGVTSFRSLQGVLGTLLGLALFVSFVGVHQAHQPFECLQVKEEEMDRELGSGTFDGRPCEVPRDCWHGDVEPGAAYACERPGLLQTSSIGRGRARYRGVMQDPNDTALVVCAALPFAFGFWSRRRSLLRTAVLLASVGLIGLCTVYTQSRGGQLVFLTVLGVYFVRRYGIWRGVLVGLAGAVPILILGGRSGEEADSSSLERTEALYAGMEIVRQHPLLGVGLKQFTDYHFITAHNAYLLAVAELGFPGFFLWSTMLYVSVKTFVVALRRYDGRPEAQVAATWALSLLASFCGMVVGIFFLSFTYHMVLFIYLGLAGAFYAACRRHDPEFRVRFTLPEAALVAVLNVVIAAAVFLYTRLKGL